MARRHVGSAPQRQFVWSDILTSMSVEALLGAPTKSVGTNLGVGIGGGVTLIRTRGWASFHFDPTSIADTFNVGIGLGVYSSDAFTIGATAMPGPLTDADYDWIFHTTLVFGPAFSATEDGTNIRNNHWLEVDSKAMRKIKPNQTIGWIAEGDVLSGGGTVDLSVSTRYLFKLG